ncbi:hypothetical protein P7K49_031022 [Saguinus oedipus]|uniref:Uncharacterized protein n=1 Tax=Saguinus oedipus TaxID=9490 RepID=A0ABQ9U3U2_SAGOE|nr:hypothetical protein P7K49_031022 [Saguinus oedipus]
MIPRTEYADQARLDQLLSPSPLNNSLGNGVEGALHKLLGTVACLRERTGMFTCWTIISGAVFSNVQSAHHSVGGTSVGDEQEDLYAAVMEKVPYGRMNNGVGATE